MIGLILLVAMADAPIVDPPAYRRALESHVPAETPISAPATLASFSADRKGEPVAVRGTIRRIFRSGPAQGLPALYEAWIVADGRSSCLVGRDDPPAARLLEVGQSVEFRGTFLGTVAAGENRRAAVIVGHDLRPVVNSGSGSVGTAWIAYDALAVGVALALVAVVFARRARRAPRRAAEPLAEPDFVS